MSKRLLDTDVLVEILKGKNPAILARATAYLAEQGHFTISAVSVMEVNYGLRRLKRDDLIQRFDSALADVEILPFDSAAATTSGQINADLERNGRFIGMLDVMIAAIALRDGLPIVTGNVAHFEQLHFMGYELLLLDNWWVGL